MADPDQATPRAGWGRDPGPFEPHCSLLQRGGLLAAMGATTLGGVLAPADVVV
jgi:hypothetical protein